MRLAALAALASCGSPQRNSRTVIDGPPTIMSPIGFSDALMPLAWLRGHWIAPTGGFEHWHAAGGALWGIALHPSGGFEVMLIDDADAPGKADGVLRFWAMPTGGPAVRFELQSLGRRSVAFANPAHDFPKTVSYRLDDNNVLHAEAAADGQPSQQFMFTYAPSFDRAPDLDARERAEGREPLASSALGTLGFTIGATPASTHVTVFVKVNDAWRIRFETATPINEQ